MLHLIRLLGVLFLLVLPSCHPSGTLIPTHPGSEDLALVKTAGGMRLLTGTAPRADRSPGPGDRGRIEMLDLEKPQDRFGVIWEQSMAPGPDHGGFVPAGLHAIPDPGNPGQTLLYIANAGQDPDRQGRVSVFEITEDRAIPRWETPGSPLLRMINGVTVTRDGTIYASNFGANPFARDSPRPGAPSPAGKPPVNTVVRFRPKTSGGTGEWEVVAHGIAGANGLALTPDEGHLLVCSYHAKTIHAFPRDPRTGNLKEAVIGVRSKLPFHPDNLKALGNHDYSVAGQRSFVGSVLQLLFKFPTGHGGGERFRWLPGRRAERVSDYTPLLRTDWQSPSTALPVGGSLFTGHVVSPGVRAFQLPKE